MQRISITKYVRTPNSTQNISAMSQTCMQISDNIVQVSKFSTELKLHIIDDNTTTTTTTTNNNNNDNNNNGVYFPNCPTLVI